MMLALSLPLVAGASELRLTVDDLLRPPLLFRVRVERAPDLMLGGEPDGPFTVQARLTQGDAVLAYSLVELQRLAPLTVGVTLVLTSQVPADAATPVLLDVTVTNPTRTVLERGRTTVRTPATLVAELTREYARVRLNDAALSELSALPALLAEQGAEIANAGAALGDWRQLDVLVRRLAAWPGENDRAVAIPGGGWLTALRDPRDGSVQPVRVLLPAVPTAVAVLLDETTDKISKSAWPLPAADLVAAATGAGVALVVAYPAGDQRWDGIAPRRVGASVDAARAVAAPAGLAWLVGRGVGAAGAVRVALRDPQRWSGVWLIAPRFAANNADRRSDDLNACVRLSGLPIMVSGAGDAAFAVWRERAHAAGVAITTGGDPTQAASWRLPIRTGAVGATWPPLPPTDYADFADGAERRIIIVVGTGEHVAAVQDNRQLAERFRAAWAAHAHGLLPVVDDSALTDAQAPGANLILVGNPRSNRVATRLARWLPVRWDSRTLTLTGAGDIPSFLRSERRAVVVQLTDPHAPARRLVLIDGDLTFADGLPLHGLGALAIGDGHGGWALQR